MDYWSWRVSVKSFKVYFFQDFIAKWAVSFLLFDCHTFCPQLWAGSLIQYGMEVTQSHLISLQLNTFKCKFLKWTGLGLPRALCNVSHYCQQLHGIQWGSMLDWLPHQERVLFLWLTKFQSSKVSYCSKENMPSRRATLQAKRVTRNHLLRWICVTEISSFLNLKFLIKSWFHVSLKQKTNRLLKICL